MKTLEFCDLMRRTGGSASLALRAIRETGLSGRMMGTARVWTEEEAARMVTHLKASKAK